MNIYSSKFIIFFFTLVSFFLIVSCSAIKKRYSTGFHIEWNKREKVISAEKRSHRKIILLSGNDSLSKFQETKTAAAVTHSGEKSLRRSKETKQQDNDLTASLSGKDGFIKINPITTAIIQQINPIKSAISLKRKTVSSKILAIRNGEESVASKILFYIACSLIILSAILMALVIETEMDILWFISVGLFFFGAIIGLVNKMMGGDWSFQSLDVAQIIVAIFASLAAVVVFFGMLVGLASFFLAF